jgi:hypothetical protein
VRANCVRELHDVGPLAPLVRQHDPQKLSLGRQYAAQVADQERPRPIGIGRYRIIQQNLDRQIASEEQVFVRRPGRLDTGLQERQGRYIVPLSRVEDTEIPVFLQ